MDLPTGFQKPSCGASDAERAKKVRNRTPPRAQNAILSRVEDSLSEPMERIVGATANGALISQLQCPIHVPPIVPRSIEGG